MYTYGPVPSRRLGQSLGVSLIPPKTCSFTCVYCQLGRTTRMQVKRESFFPREDIFSEIVERMAIITPDYLSFVGDGEPTLSKDLGWFIRQCKKSWNIPIAVITNSSLLHLKDVREDLMEADVILPSLDAGCEKTYKAVNRPHHDIKYDSIVDGLIQLREEFKGQIWLEVMLVKDINDADDELEAIGEKVGKINPDRVYVMVPSRPPAEKWVSPPSPETIIKAQKVLTGAVALAERETGEFGLDEFSCTNEAILGIGSRHPLRYEQALEIEENFSKAGEVDRMLENKELVIVKFDNVDYVLPGFFRRG